MAEGVAKSYHRTTIYLTEEQRRWLGKVAATARLDDQPISASDVIRFALTRVRSEYTDEQLRAELVRHIVDEAKEYPGRAKRGLPQGFMTPQEAIERLRAQQERQRRRDVTDDSDLGIDL